MPIPTAKPTIMQLLSDGGCLARATSHATCLKREGEAASRPQDRRSHDRDANKPRYVPHHVSNAAMQIENSTPTDQKRGSPHVVMSSSWYRYARSAGTHEFSVCQFALLIMIHAVIRHASKTAYPAATAHEKTRARRRCRALDRFNADTWTSRFGKRACPAFQYETVQLSVVAGGPADGHAAPMVVQVSFSKISCHRMHVPMPIKHVVVSQRPHL